MNKFIVKKPKRIKLKLLLCAITMVAIIPKIEAQTVTPWITTGDQTKLLAIQPSVSFGVNSGSNPSTITVNTGTTFQKMDGFGYTLTQGSAEVIMGMNSTEQNNLLNDLYNPTTGLNANIVRISIAASDLSNSSYSYNETSGDTNMTNFSLAGPDATYLIPVIKKILIINPKIKILATPWSAPRWMKTNNSWIGGSLQTTYYAAYAKYFIKYFDAMKAQGINIWGITPQNEPENGGNEPSMLMNSTEQKNFINNNLGPQMASAGYGGIKIIAFDHNCDNPGYAIDVLNNSSYVEGAAFHKYAGDISAMSTVHDATNKNVYFTEQFTAPGNFSGDFGWHMQNVVIGSTNNWSKAVLEWNAANNPSLGPRTPGGCTSCLGAVTVNNSTSYSRNVAYYIIGQISKFVKPDAFRVSTSSSNANIISVGFRNPDNSVALLVYNIENSSNTIKVVSGSSAFNYTIPGVSAVTFNWGGTAVPTVAVTGVSVTPTSTSISVSNTKQLTATIAPSNASNQSVTWSSSNTAVATVNSTGLVRGINQGTATITVKTIDGNKVASSAITVKGQEPFSGTTVNLPGVVQAENYDLGGQNLAYNDTDVSNNGGVYRTNEAVDIAAITGTSGNTVGWTADGEWLEYTTNVTEGNYSIIATVASPNIGKQLRVTLDGVKLATLTIPNTGSWDVFNTISTANISFAGGADKILRLEIIGGGFNIDKIEVKSVSSIAVTGVAMSPTASNVVAGNTVKLSATVSPSNATNKGVTWSSSNTAIATVDSSGLVTGKATGSAIITVKTNDGNKTATANINVTSATSTTSFPGFYNIISRNSNKALDVADNATSSGGRIQQYEIANGGGSNQRWKFESAGAGNFYIKVKSTNMCLVPENNTIADGIKVVQKPQVNANEYKWTITALGGGFYKIINVNSGKSLDVEGVSTSNGAAIQTWAYNGGNNQQWQFNQVELSARQDVSIENEVSFYLAPVSNTLVINSRSTKGFVTISSITGKTLLEKSFENYNVIDVSDLKQGLYIVKIEDINGVYIKKILKD
jgi:O-glycosyl hydrolase